MPKAKIAGQQHHIDVAAASEDEAGNVRRFESNLTHVMRVPKDELAKREAVYQKTRRASKPRRATR